MRKVFTFIFSALLILCLVCDIGYVWLLQHGNEFDVPITSYWGKLDYVNAEEINNDPDTAYNFVFNYYANKDNTGVELFEIKITSYNDYQLNGDVYSCGIQVINPSKMNCVYLKTDESVGLTWQNFYYKYIVSYEKNSVKYFNANDGISFAPTNDIEWNSSNRAYIVNIDEKPYEVKFNRVTLFDSYTVLFFMKTNKYRISTFDYFVYKCFNAIYSLKEYKTYLNLEFEFNDIFNYYEYDNILGKFKEEPSAFAYNKDFITSKINKFEKGAKVHENSIFDHLGTYSAGGLIWEE